MRKIRFSRVDILFAVVFVVFGGLNIAMISNGGSRRAKAAVCLNNLRQWGVIFKAYTDDNNGFFWTGTGPGPYFSSFNSRTGQWMYVLQDYYKHNRRLRFCPEATVPVSEAGSLGGTHTAWGVSDGPELDDPNVYDDYGVFSQGDCGSYGENRWVHKDVSWCRCYPEPRHNLWQMIDVAGGEIIPMFGGSLWYGAQPVHTDRPPPEENFELYHGITYMERVCVNRHEGFVNQVFMDLSARKVGLKSLWRLKWHRRYDLDYPLPDWESEAPWMVDFPDPE
jgi:hypothetical protein